MFLCGSKKPSSAYFITAVCKHKQLYRRHSSAYTTWEVNLTTCFGEIREACKTYLTYKCACTCTQFKYRFFCRSESCLLFPDMEVGQENNQFEMTIFSARLQWSNGLTLDFQLLPVELILTTLLRIRPLNWIWCKERVLGGPCGQILTSFNNKVKI